MPIIIFNNNTIKTSLTDGKINDVWVRLQWWLENKNTRVEAIGPSGIRGSWQFLSIKELITILDNLCKGRQNNE